MKVFQSILGSFSIVLAACFSMSGNVRADGLMTLTLSTNILYENKAAVSNRATVTIDTTLTNSLQVLVLNSDPTEISASNWVTIPAGATSAVFGVYSVNDSEIDGTQNVTITVSGAGFVPANASVQVIDDDTPGLRTLGGSLFGTIPAGTYYVTADIIIETARTLAIEAPSTLLFSNGLDLTSWGTLVADGDPTNQIKFTSAALNPTKGIWKGIHLVGGNAPQTLLDYVEISFSTIGVAIEPTSNNPKVLVSHSSIHDCSGTGIRVHTDSDRYIGPADVFINTNRVYNNDSYGIDLSSVVYGCDASRNAAAIQANEVFDNADAGIALRAEASDSTGCSGFVYSTLDGVVVRNFVYRNNQGLHLYADKGFFKDDGKVLAQVSNNLVVSNRSDGIWIGNQQGSIMAPDVINNTVVSNASGISHGPYFTAGFVIANNLVVSNSQGILSRAAFTATNLVVANNDVWGNAATNWVNYPAQYGLLVTTNRNGAPADVYFNISSAPLFADETSHIPHFSPAVNAGEPLLSPLTDFDGEFRVGFPDIGCDEWTPLSMAIEKPNAGQTKLMLTGGRSSSYVIETSTNLQSWTAMTNLFITNITTTLQVFTPPNPDCVFYRGRIP